VRQVKLLTRKVGKLSNPIVLHSLVAHPINPLPLNLILRAERGTVTDLLHIRALGIILYCILSHIILYCMMLDCAVLRNNKYRGRERERELAEPVAGLRSTLWLIRLF